MLIYHPAFDPHHCAFRLLSLTDVRRELEFVRARILDFYLCFPAEVASVQVPQSFIEIKRAARAIKNPYRGPVSSLRTFREMEAIQSVAARLIASAGLFDAESLETGWIRRTDQEPPPELANSLRMYLNGLEDVQKYIASSMVDIPLLGVGGLKQRTGLLEYRYDVA